MPKHQQFANCIFFFDFCGSVVRCVEVCGDGVERSFFDPAYCA